MGGFWGKLAIVNLSNRDVRIYNPPKSYYKMFIGGSGLGARIFIDLGGLRAEPLSPDNPILFMAGPLTGTRYPLASRHFVCARSPLTGVWGQGSAGGSWGAMLKKAGFDGIAVLGRAEKPVYIYVSENGVDVRDAGHLWGLDAFEAEETLKKDLGEKGLSVASIGQAGENMVRMAAIQNDLGRMVGRTGLGAVMGSKRLKAIAVSGSLEVPIEDEDGFRELYPASLRRVLAAPATKVLRNYGTDGLLKQIYEFGDLPIKYWSKGVWDEERIDRLTGEYMAKTILAGVRACYLCPIGCGREFRVGDRRGHGPEYETVASFGPLMLIDDLEFIALVGDMCNRYGLDTISTASVIAFSMELFERGLLSREDTGGIEVRWGDKEVVKILVEMIAKRRGFGDILAEGIRSVARRFGAEEYAVHVKGLDLPMHDPRAFESWTLAYATSNRGACHTYASTYYIEKGLTFPEIGLSHPLDRFDVESKPRAVKLLQDIYEFLDTMVMCRFHLYGGLPVGEVIRAFNMVTGWGIGVDYAMEVGERIFNLKRFINNVYGVTVDEDRLPPKVLRPLSEGGTHGHIPHWDWEIGEYYRLRGWDSRGVVRRDTMERLGLSDVLGLVEG